MDAKVTWKHDLAFEAVADSGKTIMLDSGSDAERQGPSPMEVILMGLAGCTAMDVVSIMEKKQQHMTAFEVKVHAERSEEYPKPYSRAEIEYIATGHALDEAALVRSIELSVQKYCPVHYMLSKAFPISQRYVILEEDGKRQIAAGSYEES
jgi:putative redox protein